MAGMFLAAQGEILKLEFDPIETPVIPKFDVWLYR